MFENVSKTLFQIKNTISADEEIIRLLNDRTYELNSQYNTDWDFEMNDIVSLVPAFEILIKDESKVGYVIISLEDDTKIGGQNARNNIISIAVVVDKNYWLIENDIRPLKIIGRICELINGKKFSLAGELSVNLTNKYSFDDNFMGYFTLVSSMSEGETNDNKF